MFLLMLLISIVGFKIYFWDYVVKPHLQNATADISLSVINTPKKMRIFIFLHLKIFYLPFFHKSREGVGSQN